MCYLPLALARANLLLLPCLQADHGIDLMHVQPQLLTKELAQNVQLLVTMGCGEACPYVPGLQKLEWQLPDPKVQWGSAEGS